MRKFKLTPLLRILGTLLALLLLVYLLRQQGWGEIWEGVRQIPARTFAVSIGLMLVSRVAVAARWHVLLRSAGVRTPFWSSLRITFAGLFASNFLPTTIGGDVFRLALALRAGYDRVVAAASLVADRLVGMAGMGSAAPLGMAPLWGGVELSGASLAPFGAVRFLERAAVHGRQAAGRLWEAARMWGQSPRGLFSAFAFTWVHQLCLFGVNWLMLDGLGEHIPFWLAGGLWSFTYFVTLLPVSVNGLGVQELSMTLIFSQWGGVSTHGAAVAALLVRTIQTLASVPGAAFLTDILETRESGDERA